MKPKEILRLILRLVGLIFLYQSLAAVPMAVNAFCPVFPHFIWKNFVPVLIMVGWPLLAAYWLIRGAPPVERWAYPDGES